MKKYIVAGLVGLYGVGSYFLGKDSMKDGHTYYSLSCDVYLDQVHLQSIQNIFDTKESAANEMNKILSDTDYESVCLISELPNACKRYSDNWSSND